jgi:hypothetical protein
MSRNIGDTSCHICNRDVVLCGEPHPITPDEAGPYYDEYAGMIVANAVCSYCDAKYLAWVKRAKWSRIGDDTRPFVDLSFRQSFNDEPSAADLPTPVMLQRVHLELCAAEASRAVDKIREMVNEATTSLADQLAKPPHWEVYRDL